MGYKRPMVINDNVKYDRGPDDIEMYKGGEDCLSDGCKRVFNELMNNKVGFVEWSGIKGCQGLMVVDDGVLNWGENDDGYRESVVKWLDRVDVNNHPFVYFGGGIWCRVDP